MERFDPVNAEALPIMDCRQVRDFDSWAIQTMGIPGVVLMENAGRAAAEWIIERLGGRKNSLVAIFCGIGNNGGDGFVIARHLANVGMEVRIFICGDSSRIKGDARINLDIIRRIGLWVQELDVIDSARMDQVVKKESYALIVDALFGTGLTGPVRNGYDRLIEALNAQAAPIVSVDIPSGLDCDTGQPLGAAIRAESTVTFVAVKKGFASNPDSLQFTGRIGVASIGIAPDWKK
ncbi:MAG: NAD(P)H-hydrate epimerase [Sedimentisphaerales bacterium]|nr:NAD(P)H-hydrate epimerase [Sedimentisphaerales bacterium]